MMERSPFVTDEELAAQLEVSIQTIRLDRMELGIPELRERTRQAAQEAINGYTTVGSFTHFKNAASPVSGDHIVIGNHVFY